MNFLSDIRGWLKRELDEVAMYNSGLAMSIPVCEPGLCWQEFVLPADATIEHVAVNDAGAVVLVGEIEQA